MARLVVCENINTILVCANAIRMRKLTVFLTKLNRYKTMLNKCYSICVWIDEADLTINCWESFLLQIDGQITFITATPGDILEKFQEEFPSVTEVPTTLIL